MNNRIRLVSNLLSISEGSQKVFLMLIIGIYDFDSCILQMTFLACGILDELQIKLVFGIFLKLLSGKCINMSLCTIQSSTMGNSYKSHPNQPIIKPLFPG